MKRLASIDVLRAIAILLMVQVHFVENLSPEEQSLALLRTVSFKLGSMSAPIFTFLVGLSLWLWLRRAESAGEPRPTIAKAVIRRGLSIFAAGFVFAVAIWLPREVFDWDILTFIGAAIVVLYFLRNWSIRRLLILTLLILLVSPYLRTCTGYETHWKDFYVYKFTVGDVFFGFMLHGYFPLLPWLAFPLVGFVVGRHFFADQSTERLTSWLLPGLGCALLALAGIVSFTVEEPDFSVLFFRWTFYPASTTLVLGALGLMLLGLWLLHRTLDVERAGKDGAVLLFFRRYSRFSFTTYVVHHAVHIWPLYLFAALRGKNDLTYYEGEAVSTPTALLLAALFIVAFYPVLMVWKKRRYSLEWVLRWLSDA